MLALSGNQFWERLKDLLVYGPLRALLAAVINISILCIGNRRLSRRHHPANASARRQWLAVVRPLFIHADANIAGSLHGFRAPLNCVVRNAL